MRRRRLLHCHCSSVLAATISPRQAHSRDAETGVGALTGQPNRMHSALTAGDSHAHAAELQLDQAGFTSAPDFAPMSGES